MLLESTVIPVPSELVVAPAAFRAAAGELDIWLVILLATLGADCGASINYAAGYYLGRPIIYRFANSRLGHLCLLNQHKVEKSEKYFYDHGMVATITGRLLPGIRHLISIPAGLAKMHYWKFLLYTTIGAGAWNCILAALGWYLHSIVPKEQLHDKSWSIASISSSCSWPQCSWPSSTSWPSGISRSASKAEPSRSPTLISNDIHVYGKPNHTHEATHRTPQPSLGSLLQRATGIDERL